MFAQRDGVAINAGRHSSGGSWQVVSMRRASCPCGLQLRLQVPTLASTRHRQSLVTYDLIEDHGNLNRPTSVSYCSPYVIQTVSGRIIEIY